MADLSNLAGVQVFIQDGGLRISDPVRGPKVTLLGATTGNSLDVGDPYITPTVESGYVLTLEDDGTPSELTRAFEEAYAGGARLVEFVRIADASGDSLSLDGRYAALQTAYDELLNHDVNIVVPVNAYIDKPAASGDFGYQLADFCYQSTLVNKGTIGVIGHRNALQLAEEEYSETFTDLSGNPISSAQATPSLTQVERWVRDTAGTSTYRGFTFASGYDGVTDDNGDGLPEYYRYWAASGGAASNPNGVTAGVAEKDARNNPIDIGAYISVVSSNTRIFTQSAQALYPEYGYYNVNPVSHYAGMISSLIPHSATTNKLARELALQRNPSFNQTDRLIRGRFITHIQKPKGVVVARGVTGGHWVSSYYKTDYLNLTTVRIAHEVINVIRAVADPYIGEPNNAVKLASLEQAVDSALGTMQEGGALNGYRFQIHATPSERVLGTLNIDVTLIPAFEVVRINLSISLAAQ